MGKTKYTDAFPLMAQDFARRGLVDEAIAAKLGIGLTAYYDYQNRHAEFAEAIKKGKMPVDVEVENALLKRACGFEYEEVHVEYKPKADDPEGAKAKPTLIKKIKKMVVPDTAACIIWLKNRRPALWKDKHEMDLGDVKLIVITAVPRPNGRKNNNAKAKKKRKG